MTAQVQDFEKVARRECAELLAKVREAFRPSEGIEAIVIVAFTRGAAWALDIDVDKTLERQGLEDGARG